MVITKCSKLKLIVEIAVLTTLNHVVHLLKQLAETKTLSVVTTKLTCLQERLVTGVRTLETNVALMSKRLVKTKVLFVDQDTTLKTTPQKFVEMTASMTLFHVANLM
jgi:hypothetical protein